MSEVGTRIYRFGDEEIDAPEDMDIQQVRGVWAQVHPALENAEAFEEEDGSVTFRQQGGTKGC